MGEGREKVGAGRGVATTGGISVYIGLPPKISNHLFTCRTLTRFEIANKTYTPPPIKFLATPLGAGIEGRQGMEWGPWYTETA